MPAISEVHLDDLLRLTIERGASDLHITVGLPPMIRVNGQLEPTDYDRVTPHDSQRLIYDILSDAQLERFERESELDCSYGISELGRFRVNIYRQRGSIGAAMRAIPTSIPTLEELNLPAVLRDLTNKSSGLVLVTGPTGSGKSTTLASMLNIINENEPVHIVTIEDPIEYLHRHKTAMVNQRELGTDTNSFASAARAALREDPDVVLVGEMRDLETCRETKTRVRVKIGQTLVIGGLISEEEVRSMSKVPILGDIPILGELFKRRKVTTTPSEVLMFITPRVVDVAGEAQEVL